MPFAENSTVVVAHGAWADGSSWKEVILPLSKQGLQVVAAPLPLTSLTDDIAALNRTIARTRLSQVHGEPDAERPAVGGLVQEGETVAQVFYRDEAHPQGPKLGS